MMQELQNYCSSNDIPFSVKEPEASRLITFTSWIKEIDVVNAGSDIIALSSDNEGTPVSLIEAQASSKPIVTTDVGGIRNIVVPGKTALIVPKGNRGLFAQALLKLVENHALRAELSDKSREFVADKFHYTRLVADMKKLYFELLKR